MQADRAANNFCGVHCYGSMFTVIAAPRAGGVGSCWDLSTNSMSNHHLIPPYVCLLPHWVIEMLSHQHSYWILHCQTSHSLSCRKASAKACFSDLFPCCSFPLHLVFGCRAFSLDMMSSVCGSAAQVSQQTRSFPLVRIVLSQGLVLSDNVLIYWTVCSWGFITVFQSPMPSGLILGKCSLWSLGSTVFTYLCFTSLERFRSISNGKTAKLISLVRYSSYTEVVFCQGTGDHVHDPFNL